MRVRWTEAASDDLEGVADYLLEHASATATRDVRAIYEAAEGLVDFPRRGRPGRRAGTRELVLSPLPYLIVYRIAEKDVLIVRILHSRQRWPR
jgi:addiction module RelE/StbE family toxin